ncbi:hypothetical protein BaRGS_00029094 [Batillaria attramentaria]|uniref:Uncharacterized protein n=1 Tax=Batillaria attramentaria TaxID=370345 RepID=A0ABD0JXU0_9CAEN
MFAQGDSVQGKSAKQCTANSRHLPQPSTAQAWHGTAPAGIEVIVNFCSMQIHVLIRCSLELGSPPSHRDHHLQHTYIHKRNAPGQQRGTRPRRGSIVFTANPFHYWPNIGRETLRPCSLLFLNHRPLTVNSESRCFRGVEARDGHGVQVSPVCVHKACTSTIIFMSQVNMPMTREIQYLR